MTKRQSISEARRSLPSLVREAEAGKTVQLTRRGEPVAILLGQREYERLTSKYRKFSSAYADFTREIDLMELAIDPAELFAGVRAGLDGRVVHL